MKPRLALYAIPALIVSSTLVAQESDENAQAEIDQSAQTADAQDQADSKTDAGSKMKCKYQHVVGSRIPQRVCFTVDEWEEIRLKILEEARGARNRSSTCSGGGRC